MARALRISLHDGWYHVFHRGTERRSIFVDDRDRNHFLNLLAEVHERYRFRIHAVVLMTNHYHAILQTPDANLSVGMQWLHLSYAAWFNARHSRVGPFWQGRFRSVPVENSAWAHALSLLLEGSYLGRKTKILIGRSQVRRLGVGSCNNHRTYCS